jgi:hypothetical protein
MGMVFMGTGTGLVKFTRGLPVPCPNQETGSGEEDEEETSSSDEEEDVKELFTALVTPESRATARLSA